MASQEKELRHLNNDLVIGEGIADGDRNTRLRSMIWLQGQIIGRHTECPSIFWFAVDGKVYADQEGTITELGDYFRFLEDLEAATTCFKRVDSLTSRLHKSFQDHLALASKYERGGNTEGARYLRYVSNLLAAFLRGDTPSTILPDA